MKSKILCKPPLNSFIHINPSLDLNNIAKRRLDAQGVKYKKDSQDAFLQLLNWQSKQIPQRARNIRSSEKLVIPEENQEGFNTLVNDVLMGKNLNIYLSTNTEKPHFTDSLLNTEGLVHFHLSAELGEPNKKFKQRYVVRSSNLLIAKVTENTVYFLIVVPHEHPDWSEEEYKGLKATELTFYHDQYPHIIANEFPELLDSRMKIEKMELVLDDGTPVNLTTKGRAYLKKSNTNSCFTTIGNQSYFNNIVSASGHNVKHVRATIIINNLVAREMIDISDWLFTMVTLDSDYQYKIKLKYINDNIRFYVMKDNGVEVLSFLAYSDGTIKINKKNEYSFISKKKNEISDTLYEIGCYSPFMYAHGY